MKLSVLILNYNHKHFIKLAVEALEKSVFAGKFEIIVIDNNSSDQISRGFIQNAEKAGRVKAIYNSKNLGFAKAYNEGIKCANGKFIYIHNPDTQVRPDSLQKLFSYLEKHEEIGILAPKLVYANGEIQASCRRRMKFFDLIIKRTPLSKFGYFKNRLGQYLMFDYEKSITQSVELVTGAAMMMRKSDFEAVGGFDERYFLFMEDFDLCNKFTAKKMEVVYFPDVEVEHYHKRLSDGSLIEVLRKKTLWLHLKSAVKYFWKWRKYPNY